VSALLQELPSLSLDRLGMVSKVEPRFSGPSAGSLVHRCDSGLGDLPSAGADGSLLICFVELNLERNNQKKPLVSDVSLSSVQAPIAQHSQCDEGERDVRPWASDVQVQIFTDLLPAAGDSLPEENQASPGRVAAGVPWTWFDFAHHPEEDRGEGSPRSPN